jgi:hypothetical protein
MTPDDMEGRLTDALAALGLGGMCMCRGEDLRALLLDYQERGRALEEAQSMLRECLRDYGHPNFTDRHGMADRIRATLKGKSHE